MQSLRHWMRQLYMIHETFDTAEVKQLLADICGNEHAAEILGRITMRWEARSLRCYVRVLDIEDSCGNVILVSAAYRLSLFTTYRLLSLGRFCLGMTMAFMVGRDNHMVSIRTLLSIRSYHRHCFNLLDALVRTLFEKSVVVAICTDQLRAFC